MHCSLDIAVLHFILPKAANTLGCVFAFIYFLGLTVGRKVECYRLNLCEWIEVTTRGVDAVYRAPLGH